MNHNVNLDKLMNEKGFWSFDFFSLCPMETGKPSKYGNFEFVTQKSHGTIELLVRYLGTNPTFTWLNMAATPSPRQSYSYQRETQLIQINNHLYSKIDRSWGGVNKNKTFTPASVVHNLEDAKKNRDGLGYNIKISYGKEPEIKLFKKEVKAHKARWEQAKIDVVETAFGITYEEWLKDQIQVQDAEATKFILKIAPMLTRLKDECTSILYQLNEPAGPSKQAREDFFTAYQRFQQHYNRRTYLTGLKHFKSQKGKSKKK